MFDRGYYDSDNEELAYEAGVKNVCISKLAGSPKNEPILKIHQPSDGLSVGGSESKAISVV